MHDMVQMNDYLEGRRVGNSIEVYVDAEDPKAAYSFNLIDITECVTKTFGLSASENIVVSDVLVRLARGRLGMRFMLSI